MLPDASRLISTPHKPALQPRIGVIVEQRYLRQNMPMAAVHALCARGLATDVICPDDGYFSFSDGVFSDAAGKHFALTAYDAILSRNRHPLGLVLLRYAEENGIAVINSHTSVQKVRNKAKMAAALAVAGVKMAPTAAAANVHALALHQDLRFPLILKATYGDNSQGLRLVRDKAELMDVVWPDDVVLVQHYLANDHYDIKLYCCGQSIVPVRKPSPFNGDPSAPSQIVPLTPALEELARKCGDVFDLEIYGVDCVEADGEVFVIEVNDFPNYTGLDDAAGLIADHVVAACSAKTGYVN